MTRITRVEIITDTGRDYVCWEEDNDITVSYQDDGKTLKVFVNTMKPKSPAEEAYKRVYGAYPMGEPFWIVFEKGYNASQKDYKVGEFQPTPQEPKDNEWKTVALGFGENLSAIGPDGYYDFTPVEWYDWVVDIYENTANEYLKLLQKERAKAKSKEPEKWDVVRESKKWCEEHPDENPLDWVKPQTPEQVADGLKEAFREAVKQGIVSSVDEPTKPMNEVLDRLENKYENDDVVNRILKKWEENPPDFLRFQLGKSLEDRIYKWWETCFVHHPEWSMEECVEDLLDIITLFLPAEQSHEGTQNIDTVVAVEAHNELLQKIKSKLRNKKVTP